MERLYRPPVQQQSTSTIRTQPVNQSPDDNVGCLNIRPRTIYHTHCYIHRMFVRKNVPSRTCRRPLPDPHKNFRIILLSTASPEDRAQNAGRRFGMGESSVVWWRPAPASALQPAAGAMATKGQAMDSDSTVTFFRDEIVHELASNAAIYDYGEFASAGVGIISESCAR